MKKKKSWFFVCIFLEDSTSFTPQNNRQQPAVKDDDRYVAELLARYGDADESARRQWREAQQNSRSEQLPPQSSKGNIKTEVRPPNFSYIIHEFTISQLFMKNKNIFDVVFIR